MHVGLTHLGDNKCLSGNTPTTAVTAKCTPSQRRSNQMRWPYMPTTTAVTAAVHTATPSVQPIYGDRIRPTSMPKNRVQIRPLGQSGNVSYFLPFTAIGKASIIYVITLSHRSRSSSHQLHTSMLRGQEDTVRATDRRRAGGAATQLEDGKSVCDGWIMTSPKHSVVPLVLPRDIHYMDTPHQARRAASGQPAGKHEAERKMRHFVSTGASIFLMG